MTQITISGFSPTTPVQFSGTAAVLRIYASESFEDNLGNLVIGSPVGSADYYQPVVCSINPSTRILSIPSFQLTSTTDAQQLGRTYSGVIYDAGKNRHNTLFSQFSLSPSLGLNILYSDWVRYNASTSILFPPFQTLTTDQIQALVLAHPGISTLNTLTAAVQNFAVGAAGVDFAIGSAGSAHTFNIPTASATNRGLVSAVDWTQFNTGTGNIIAPVTVTNANLTINAQGRITAAATGSGGGGGGGVSSVDASGGVETVSGSPITATGSLRGTEQVNAQTGSGTYLVVIGDRGKLITVANAGAPGMSFPSAASFGAGWYCDVQNIGPGMLTINLIGNIDSDTGLFLYAGSGVRIVSTGSGWTSQRGLSHAGSSTSKQVLFNTGSANGAGVGGSSLLVFDTNNLPKITTPEIITALLDANANELISVIATALAVNQLQVTNSATGNAPELAAIGDDANVNLKLTAKGTGYVFTAGAIGIGTSIFDSNGKSVLDVGATASAVNNLKTTNAAATGSPTLSAVGADTNISLTLTPKGTGATIIGGTGTNDNAAAGKVGEIVSSLISVGAQVSLTSTVAANVTFISLSPGDWDVEGNINFSLAAATVTATQGGLSTTTATMPTDGSEVYSGLQATTLTAKNAVTLPRKRVSTSGSPSVFLVAQVTFSAGAMNAFGSITARRVR